jgi:Cu/Ag efflux protein CusF
MRAWHLVLVINVALATGAGAGYFYWGRQAEQLALELQAARKAPPRPEREWTDVAGVVRAVIPEVGVMVLSHADMPGYMRPMTMGFKVASPQLYQKLEVGDEVRFTLRGNPPRVSIVAIEKIAPQ